MGEGMRICLGNAWGTEIRGRMWIDRAEMGDSGAHINHAIHASLASLTSILLVFNHI